MRSSFVDYTADLLSNFGSIKVKSMFGGYGIYCNNVIFAIVVDDELYFKTDKALSKDFQDIGSSPFTYEARGKIVSMSYYKVPIEIIEDAEQLRYWFGKVYNVAKNLVNQRLSC